MNHKYGIFSPSHRPLTVGIILAVTVVAFESLAVTTITPVLAKDLRGIDLYGWVFSAYLLAQLTGTVVTGQHVDQRGPALPSVCALLLFGFGLVTAAIAPSMPILIVGRAFQGFGAGALINCVYSSISFRYDDTLRAQILAVFSSAFVIPALIGPYVAGLIAEHLTWRLVFWGLLPFLPLTAVLTLPTFVCLTPKDHLDEPSKPGDRSRVWSAVGLVIGTGLLLSGLKKLPQILGMWFALGGLVLTILQLRRLLPAGTLVARSGLPAIIAARGLFVASYGGTETFLVFALTAVKGYPTDTAGLVVASGALSWSTAAWLQARLDQRDRGQGRRKRVLVGVALMLVGIGVAIQMVWDSDRELLLAIVSHIFTGLGVGLAHTTSSAIAFTHTTERSQGIVSADLQVADTFTPAVSIGVGGALVAISHSSGWTTHIGVTAALGVQFLLMMVSLLAAYRLPHHQLTLFRCSRQSKI